MKAMIALLTGLISSSFPAYGRDPFPVNQQFEVMSFGSHVLTHDRMKVLFEHPIDGKSGYTMMDVRVAPGCFNWELRVKVHPSGEFYLNVIRQTTVWCAEVTEVERAFAAWFGEATRWHMDGKVLVLHAAGGDMRLQPLNQH